MLHYHWWAVIDSEKYVSPNHTWRQTTDDTIYSMTHVQHISIVYLFCNILGVQYEVNNWCILCHKILFYNFNEFREHSFVPNCHAIYYHNYTRRQPFYSDSWSCTVIKSVLTSFGSLDTHCFLHKYIVWYRNFIYMQSSMVSFTLLIACTTSGVAVRWLSSSVHVNQHKSWGLEIDMALHAHVNLTSVIM